MPDATRTHEIPDEQLIRRTLDGQRSAFAEIVARYREGVMATARYVLGNNDDAQDAVQETFVYAYQHLAELRSHERLLPWLRRVAVHRCYDLRRRKATRRQPAQPENHDNVAGVCDVTLTVLDRSVLVDALALLPPIHRQTIELFHLQGHSLEETATQLQIPLNTVRSRLQAARRTLYNALAGTFPERILFNTMPVTTETKQPTQLPADYDNLIRSRFPEAEIIEVQENPELWMPFSYRIRLGMGNGFVQSVDIRGFSSIAKVPPDDNGDALALLDVLQRCGLPVPQRLAGPIIRADGQPVALCVTPIGENLLQWAFDGNPHRIRRATDLGITAIDQLHAITPQLEKDPLGSRLPRRSLADDLEEIIDKGGPWLNEATFSAALHQFRPMVERIALEAPLVYTNDLYFPNFLRVENDHITEFIEPFGWFGDPLLGLAKFWTYDCYPFVHTGFVERYLFDKGYSRRDFAPRLAVRALWTLQRETSAEQLPGENGYRDELLRLLRYALEMR